MLYIRNDATIDHAAVIDVPQCVRRARFSPSFVSCMVG